MFVLYLDAATDRVNADFRSSVEAARMAAIFATDQKQYDKWRRSSASKQTVMDDRALEAAIMKLVAEYPENVSRGVI